MRTEPSSPPVSVVVATRDRPRGLTATLAAVRAACRDGDEVVVVDSASRGSGTREVALAAGARLVSCERPGASRARNAGWRAAAHDLVAFTDDDCRPEVDWLAELAAGFAPTQPHAAQTGFAFGRVRPGPGDGPALSVLEDPEPVLLRPDGRVRRLGHGANMAFRRATLLELGGFDEVLGAGAPLRGSEDKDAFWRSLAAGWVGRYLPEAVVVHARRAGRRDAISTSFGYGMGEGALAVKQAREQVSGTAPALELGWRPALARARADAAAGYELGAAMGLTRALGAVVGGLRARRRPLVDGRYTP